LFQSFIYRFFHKMRRTSQTSANGMRGKTLHSLYSQADGWSWL